MSATAHLRVDASTEGLTGVVAIRDGTGLVMLQSIHVACPLRVEHGDGVAPGPVRGVVPRTPPVEDRVGRARLRGDAEFSAWLDELGKNR
jgi:hypothetical protein